MAHVLMKLIIEQLYRILTIDVEPAGARYNPSFVFCRHRVPASIVLCCWLNEETHVSCCILAHAEINRQWKINSHRDFGKN